MTTVYFVRHVQASGNLNQSFQGQIDTEVSANGMIQIENLRGRFTKVHLDAVYSSPLKRAVATAGGVKGIKDIPLILVDGLKEINAGAWEGMPLTQIEADYPDELELWRSRMWEFRVPGSESGEEVYHRTGKALEEILKKEKGRTIAVVSHGCALKNMLCYACGLTPQQVGEIGWLSNGSITIMKFDDGIPGEITVQNDHEHIHPDTMLPPVNILKKREVK